VDNYQLVAKRKKSKRGSGAISRNDFIHKELSQFQTISIPFMNVHIQNHELENWIAEELSPDEINEIILLLQKAKRRSSSIKPIFQVIAAGFLKKRTINHV